MLKRKGFTLLELMIVVIIIGILATVAIPQFTSVVEKARAAEAITILGSIRTGMSLYYLESGVYPANQSSLSGISSILGLDATSTLWNFATTDPSATATRNSQTITLNYKNGSWSGNHPGVPKN